MRLDTFETFDQSDDDAIITITHTNTKTTTDTISDTTTDTKLAHHQNNICMTMTQRRLKMHDVRAVLHSCNVFKEPLDTRVRLFLISMKMILNPTMT